MSDGPGSWRSRNRPDRRSFRRDHYARGDAYEQPESLDYGVDDVHDLRGSARARHDTYDRQADRERWRRSANDGDCGGHSRWGSAGRNRRADRYTQTRRERWVPPPREERWVPPPREERWEDDGDEREEDAPAEEREQPQEEGPSTDADDPDAQMAALMGFGSFGSSKGKPVEGNDVGYAYVKKERTWRQYMNRCVGANEQRWLQPASGQDLGYLVAQGVLNEVCISAGWRCVNCPLLLVQHGRLEYSAAAAPSWGQTSEPHVFALLPCVSPRGKVCIVPLKERLHLSARWPREHVFLCGEWVHDVCIDAVRQWVYVRGARDWWRYLRLGRPHERHARYEFMWRKH